MTYDYFYGQQAEMFTFYRVPKVLFTEECFWNVSTDAKLLYGILLDRMNLSARNGWLDEEGRVYIIFTIEEIKGALGCAEKKAVKLLDELEKKCGLIERNPFAYIHSEKDILKLVTTLIANTKGDGKAGDEFWTKAETLLYCALIGYIHYEAPVEEQNFSTLIEFLNAMEVREDDEEFQNPVDLMFEALEKKKPNHFAVRQYKKYKHLMFSLCLQDM